MMDTPSCFVYGANGFNGVVGKCVEVACSGGIACVPPSVFVQ